MNGAGRSVWVGRVLSALAVLFLGFDTAIKLVQLPVVGETLAQLGYPSDLGLTIGIVELVCLVLYAVPRTAVLGAILLTAVFGGAHREPHSHRVAVVHPHLVRRLSGVVRLGRAVSTQRASPRSHPAATLTCSRNKHESRNFEGRNAHRLRAARQRSRAADDRRRALQPCIRADAENRRVARGAFHGVPLRPARSR